MSINWSRLTEPFPPDDVEWRVSRAGKNSNGIWAKVLAYITARAIHERLDEVFGPDGWKNEFRQGPSGGVICRIYFRDEDGEWVWREDGAENTDIEAVKGGLSGAMKRAGAVLGIGRYLYNLDEGWADVRKNGRYYGKLPKKEGGDSFRWDPPKLPTWALPGGNGKPESEPVNEETGEVEDDPEPAPDELVKRVQGLLDLAAMQNVIDPDQAARIEGAISERDENRLLIAVDWLRGRTEQDEEETEDEPEPAGV